MKTCRGLAQQLSTDCRHAVTFTLIKDGDHRLSRPQDIAMMIRTALALADHVDGLSLKGGEPFAISRIGRQPAERRLDPRIRDTLALGVETLRRRRKAGVGEGDGRRRRESEQVAAKARTWSAGAGSSSQIL